MCAFPSCFPLEPCFGLTSESDFRSSSLPRCRLLTPQGGGPAAQPAEAGASPRPRPGVSPSATETRTVLRGTWGDYKVKGQRLLFTLQMLYVVGGQEKNNKRKNLNHKNVLLEGKEHGMYSCDSVQGLPFAVNCERTMRRRIRPFPPPPTPLGSGSRAAPRTMQTAGAGLNWGVRGRRFPNCQDKPLT